MCSDGKCEIEVTPERDAARNFWFSLIEVALAAKYPHPDGLDGYGMSIWDLAYMEEGVQSATVNTLADAKNAAGDIFDRKAQEFFVRSRILGAIQLGRKFGLSKESLMKSVSKVMEREELV